MAGFKTITGLLRVEYADIGNAGLALLDKSEAAAGDTGPLLRTAQGQFFLG